VKTLIGLTFCGAGGWCFHTVFAVPLDIASGFLLLAIGASTGFVGLLLTVAGLLGRGQARQVAQVEPIRRKGITGWQPGDAAPAQSDCPDMACSPWSMMLASLPSAEPEFAPAREYDAAQADQYNQGRHNERIEIREIGQQWPQAAPVEWGVKVDR
jgi:hypothetical protein